MVDDKFVNHTKTKADIFNNFFAEQCTPSKNDSKRPSNQIYLTQSKSVSLDFNEDEVLKIIRSLNIHKAHGYDDISIRMIKICDKSLLKPLISLFKNSTKSSHYPDIYYYYIISRHNIIPVKFLRKLFLTKFIIFLMEEKLLNPNQSAFRPSDS